MIDNRPVALDFFCCEGGLSAGLEAAGFRVIGVDNKKQPKYPYEFVLADAIKDFGSLLWKYRPAVAGGSPPCQLCGYGNPFNLKTDRHRLFETGGGFKLVAPPHNDHRGIRKTKMGRPFVDGELRQYIGNFTGPKAAREDLNVPWMSRDGIRECVPPAYGEYLGRQLLEVLP